MKKKTLVIALGGNALIKKGQRGTAEEQLKNLRTPIEQIARISANYKVVITHGNGPQVGNLLLQQESCKKVPKMPLEILVAQTQGQIGYMIESTLDEALMRLGIDKLFLTVITYVKVNPKDPALKNPTKPIGPAYKSPRQGFVKTAKGYRRVVPSPKPVKIYQWREIKKLLESDFIVIACGGGGIPVIKKGKNIVGVEAVIDKDLASAKLAEQLKADTLLIVTDVKRVALNFGKPNQKYINRMSIEEAKKYLDEGQFPPGSMGPKVQAAINFLNAGGKRVIICGLNDIEKALEGKAGTQIYK